MMVFHSLDHEREFEHCGFRQRVPRFDFYANCLECGARIKLRGYSAGAEIEDLFDAFFEWLNRPGAQEVARQRIAQLANDDE